MAPGAILALGAALSACAAGGAAPGDEGPPWGAEPRAIDVAEILLGQSSAVVSFADLEPASVGPVVLRCGVPVVRVEGAGDETSVDFEHRGPLLMIDPEVTGWVDPEGLHRVKIHFAGARVPGRPLHPVLPPDPGDRVDHVTVKVVDGDLVERFVIPGTPRPTGLIPDSKEGQSASAYYVAACERRLLVRMPRSSASPAAAWFGELVAIAPGDAGASIASLPRVLATLADMERPGLLGELDASGVLALGPADGWAVPRHLALRERLGPAAYLAALRELVDRHRGRGPTGNEDLAAVLEDQGSSDGAAFVRTWLSGPGRALVKISTRHDPARGRLLVRVDQVQPVDDGGVAAYPFELPVRVTVGGAEPATRVLEVTRRRELLEIPVVDAPTAVAIDPEGSLQGMVELVEGS